MKSIAAILKYTVGIIPELSVSWKYKKYPAYAVLDSVEYESFAMRRESGY